MSNDLEYSLGLRTEQFQAGVKQTLAAAKSIDAGMKDAFKIFTAGGALFAIRNFFTAAVSYAREYKGATDENIQATLRFGESLEKWEQAKGRLGSWVVGTTEKAAIGLASLVYGTEAATSALDQMNAASEKALDAERAKPYLNALDQLAKVNRDIAYAEGTHYQKLTILLNEQVNLKGKIRDVGEDTIEGLKLQGELARTEQSIRKVTADIIGDEKKSADEKAEAERKTTEELHNQKAARDILIAKIKEETAATQAKIAAEAAATVKSANAAAQAQGFEPLSPQEEAALKDWIAGGKQGPAPVTRAGSVMDTLSQKGSTSRYLVDGKWYDGSALGVSAFENQSPAVLAEFIRRREQEIQAIESGKGSAGSPEIANNYLVRGIVQAVLKTEIGRARSVLDQNSELAGVGYETGLRNFKGSPLDFDRLWQAANGQATELGKLNDNLKKFERTVQAIPESLKSLGDRRP